MVPWLGITIPTLLVVGSATAVVRFHVQDKLNLFLMGFFRDLGRVKAYKRRHEGNSMALMTTILFKQEDPLMGIDFMEEPDHDIPVYTEDELWEYGRGDDDDDKLLLSVFGRIYDVTKGSRFYGPDARYHMFPGRDVTYALGTGCKTDECLEKTVDDFDGPSQLDEAKRWLSYFQLHDKYAYVGKLQDNPMEAFMDAWIEEAIAKQQANGGERVAMPKVFGNNKLKIESIC